MMLYYTIYKVTNLANDKIYIGKHVTKNPNDDYMGSGKILKNAIEKYGISMFEKEVLYAFDKKEDMDLMEAEIVDEEFLARSDTYNLRLGGEGGWDYINENGLNAKSNGLSPIEAELLKQRHREGKYKTWADTYSWVGKKHNEESKKKIGKANAVHQKGKKNSQYGTCWIFSEGSGESTKIKKEDLPFYLARGYKKGRKMK